MGLKTADLCDKYSDELQICQIEFKSYGKKNMFSGPIHTVDVFDDNVLVREALETVPEGSVLVVDGKGSRNVALMGDNLGDIAVARKLAGVIINGCIRDAAEIGQLDIGVFAIGTVPLKSVKGGKGSRDTRIAFGGVAWEPGNYVYADEDGVVLSTKPLSLD